MHTKKLCLALSATLAVFVTLVASAGAQPGAASSTTTEAAVTPRGALGGYQPVSDVGQHAKMSADVCDINSLLDARPIDFAAVGVIYRDRRHSPAGTGSKRTRGKVARERGSAGDTLGRVRENPR